MSLKDDTGKWLGLMIESGLTTDSGTRFNQEGQSFDDRLAGADTPFEVAQVLAQFLDAPEPAEQPIVAILKVDTGYRIYGKTCGDYVYQRLEEAAKHMAEWVGGSLGVDIVTGEKPNKPAVTINVTDMSLAMLEAKLKLLKEYNAL